MKKSHTNIIFILSVIMAITTICLFIFLFYVIRNKNEHASAVLVTLEEKIKEKENAVIFSERKLEIENIQHTIDDYFVDPNKIDTFVSYLEDLNKDAGVEISVESIEIPPKTKNTISIKLSAEGDFQEVIKTIYLLENIPYQVNFTQVNLNQNIQQPIIKEGKNVSSEITTWQADVSFNILSL